MIFPGWGDTWSVDYLGDRRIPSLFYMHGLIEGLKEDPFFVPNISLRAAPFDFRQFPSRSLKHCSTTHQLTFSPSSNCSSEYGLFVSVETPHRGDILLKRKYTDRVVSTQFWLLVFFGIFCRTDKRLEGEIYQGIRVYGGTFWRYGGNIEGRNQWYVDWFPLIDRIHEIMISTALFN